MARAASAADIARAAPLITPANVAWAKRLALSVKCAAPLGRDDAIGAALFGLWEAALDYGADGEASFRSYAYKRVRGAVFDAARRNDHLPRWYRDKIGHDDDAAPDDRAPVSLEIVGVRKYGESSLFGGYWSWQDVIAGPSEDIAARVALTEAVCAIEGYDGAVLRCWLGGMLGCEIAVVLGVSPSRVSQRLHRALRELRARLDIVCAEDLAVAVD